VRVGWKSEVVPGVGSRNDGRVGGGAGIPFCYDEIDKGCIWSELKIMASKWNAAAELHGTSAKTTSELSPTWWVKLAFSPTKRVIAQVFAHDANWQF